MKNLGKIVGEMLLLSSLKKDILVTVHQLIEDSTYTKEHAIVELLEIIDRLDLEESKFEGFLLDVRNGKELTQKKCRDAHLTKFGVTP